MINLINRTKASHEVIKNAPTSEEQYANSGTGFFIAVNKRWRNMVTMVILLLPPIGLGTISIRFTSVKISYFRTV